MRIKFVSFLAFGLVLSAQSAVSLAAGQRIVSLDGISTEILFALGAGPKVVGRDTSSYYPAAVTKLPSVGYQFQLSPEGILSLNPTLVVGREDVKPPGVLDQLRQAGVKVAPVSTDPTLKGARMKILGIGKAVGKEAKARALLRTLDQDLARLKKMMGARKGKAAPKVLALYFRGPQTAFVLGEGTNPAGMLKLVGAKNALPQIRETKPLTPEALVAANPDVFLLFNGSLDSMGGVKGFLAVGGVAQTPAGRNKRIIGMDDLLLGGFGPRTGKAAIQLFKGLYVEKGTVIYR